MLAPGLCSHSEIEPSTQSVSRIRLRSQCESSSVTIDKVSGLEWNAGSFRSNTTVHWVGPFAPIHTIETDELNTSCAFGCFSRPSSTQMEVPNVSDKNMEVANLSPCRSPWLSSWLSSWLAPYLSLPVSIPRFFSSLSKQIQRVRVIGLIIADKGKLRHPGRDIQSPESFEASSHCSFFIRISHFAFRIHTSQ